MWMRLKRLLSRPSTTPADAAVQVFTAWCKPHSLTLKRVKDRSGDGFVITSPQGWRLEWGPSQRPYIIGPELRLRAQTDIASDVQLVLLSKVLSQKLESAVFSRYTHAMQTQVDQSLPDEMRWLAMHPRIPLSAHPGLSRRFHMVCNAPHVAQAMLEGPWADTMVKAADNWWSDALTLVVTVNRGRASLRTPGVPITAAQLDFLLPYFTSLISALNAVAHGADAPPVEARHEVGS